MAPGSRRLYASQRGQCEQQLELQQFGNTRSKNQEPSKQLRASDSPGDQGGPHTTSLARPAMQKASFFKSTKGSHHRIVAANYIYK